MKPPRAWAKPAANAAVWPKLRRKRMTRTPRVAGLDGGQQLETVVGAAVVDRRGSRRAAPTRSSVVGQLAVELRDARATRCGSG